MPAAVKGKNGKSKADRAKAARLKANRLKVRTHRAKLRSQGLRPVQFWVPDVRSPEFLAEARRQSLLLNASAQDKEDMDFIEAISDRIQA